MELSQFLDLIDPVKFKAKVESIQGQQKNLDAALEAYGSVRDVAIMKKKSEEACAAAEEKAAKQVQDAQTISDRLMAEARRANEKADAKLAQAEKDLAVLTQQKKDFEETLNEFAKHAAEHNAVCKLRDEQAATLAVKEQEVNEHLEKLRSVMQ